MTWCQHCVADSGEREAESGYIYCNSCGRVLEFDVFTNEVTFEKTSSGQARLAGTLFRGESELGISRERTLQRGRYEIEKTVDGVQISGGNSIIDPAHRFYEIAVDRSFTKGRPISYVAAACVYLACRTCREPKPYLLIDFSEYLGINVYVLGAVFLQLCHKLRLEEHPFVQKIIDPSFFIQRLTHRLLGSKKSPGDFVSETAMHIVASMKRDWMQTGRKPSGLCGAAIYISALSHGLNISKADISSAVRVCEATLTKRLVEFEDTESGGLTIEEFLTRADEPRESCIPSQLPTPRKVLCVHKDTTNVTHFAHGLCEECYNDFVKISGGLEGGAEPPAFQRAERLRMEKEKEKEKEINGEWSDNEIEAVSSSKVVSDSAINDPLLSTKSENTGSQTDNMVASNQSTNWEDFAIDDQEKESLSDIDDEEVIGYLHNEDEKQLKEIIWTEMNKEYLEEQAAKEAAAAVALPKVKKERKRRRAEDDNSSPAETPLEATRQMLDKKKLSSRINYEALDALYASDKGNTKKQLTKSDTGYSEDAQDNTMQEHEDFDMGGDQGFGEVDFSYGNEDDYPNEDQTDEW